MSMTFRRGQIFSMDLIMATVLFIATFVAFYGFITYVLVEPEEKTLVREGQQIATALATEKSPVNVLDAQELNVTKLETLTKKGYDEVKSELGIKSDFCLYLEDENGNLVKMSEQNTGVGKSSAKLHIKGNNNEEKEISCGS